MGDAAVTDVDMAWAAFDQQRGLHPRQKAAMTPAQAQSQSVIPLSPAAQAQVKIIQAKAGLPQTGQLSPALISYVHANYNTAATSGSAGKGSASSKKASSKTATAKLNAQVKQKGSGS